MHDWNPRANDIFARALETESLEHRNVFVNDICGADESLRADVLGLLESHYEAGDFLETPAFLVESNE